MRCVAATSYDVEMGAIWGQQSSKLFRRNGFPSRGVFRHVVLESCPQEARIFQRPTPVTERFRVISLLSFSCQTVARAFLVAYSYHPKIEMEAKAARAGAGPGMQQRVAQPSPVRDDPTSGAQSRPRRATPLQVPGVATRSVGNLGDASFSSSSSRVMSSRNVRSVVAPSPPPADTPAANESSFVAILQRLAAAEAEREEDHRRLAEFTAALAEERRLAEQRASELAQERQWADQQVSGLRAALAHTEQRLRQFEEQGRSSPPPIYSVRSSGGLRPASSMFGMPAFRTASATALTREPEHQLPVAFSQAQSASPPVLQQMQGPLVPQQIDIAPSPGVALQVRSKS